MWVCLFVQDAEAVLAIAPRKPNWDLKRDVERKMQTLAARTDRAVVQLIRQRMKKDVFTTNLLSTSCFQFRFLQLAPSAPPLFRSVLFALAAFDWAGTSACDARGVSAASGVKECTKRHFADDASNEPLDIFLSCASFLSLPLRGLGPRA
eukprot:s2100_g9.t1